MCISEGEAVWVLYVDAYVLEHDGNCFDTTLLAILTALANVKLPQVEINEEQVVSVVDSQFTQLELDSYPIPLTFCVIDGYMLVDPTSEEEQLATTTFTIVYNNKQQLCALYKSGGSSIKDSLLEQCQEIAKKRIDYIVTLIKQT